MQPSEPVWLEEGESLRWSGRSSAPVVIARMCVIVLVQIGIMYLAFRFLAGDGALDRLSGELQRVASGRPIVALAAGLGLAALPTPLEDDLAALGGLDDDGPWNALVLSGPWRTSLSVESYPSAPPEVEETDSPPTWLSEPARRRPRGSRGGRPRCVAGGRDGATRARADLQGT